MSELSDAVRRRAGGRCEFFRRPFHVEHIIARQHGGATEMNNLALACWLCNLKKGPNLAGIDPESGQVTALFHPRRDRWAEHFRMLIQSGMEIRGLTPTGRATVRVLGMNEEMRQMLRHELWLESLYPEV
jgi:hypothetical protein